MLFAQFLAAVVVNHLKFRRRLWLTVSILQRLILVPVAVGAWFWPEAPEKLWIWGLIVATAANHTLLHFCTPLWLSWMGDYLPRAGLSRFWGRRHMWMQWTASASLLVGATLLFEFNIDIRAAFAVLVGAGAVFGVADILIFLKVEEPQVKPAQEPRLRDVLAAPFCHAEFRTFIGYSCFWNFAAMAGAPFISLYLLTQIRMELSQVLLLWTFSWIGGAVVSNRFGVMAEIHGNRPVLILCTAFKSINMIALIFTPRDPTLAFWFLAPVFMIDAVLNAGIAIASNGFMLKNSPQANRSMFIAAGMALAGMVGGLTSVLAGGALAIMQAYGLGGPNVAFDAFQILFAASLVFRLAATIWARRLREPDSAGAKYVAMQLVGATPLRMLRFPVGLYRETSDFNVTQEKTLPPKIETAVSVASEGE